MLTLRTAHGREKQVLNSKSPGGAVGRLAPIKHALNIPLIAVIRHIVVSRNLGSSVPTWLKPYIGRQGRRYAFAFIRAEPVDLACVGANAYLALFLCLTLLPT